MQDLKVLIAKASEAALHWDCPGMCLDLMTSASLRTGGYPSKFPGALLAQVPMGAKFAVLGSHGAMPITWIGDVKSVTYWSMKGAAALTGHSSEDLKSNLALYEHSLNQIDSLVRQLWPSGLPRPEASSADLPLQLCTWMSSKCSAESINFPGFL